MKKGHEIIKIGVNYISNAEEVAREKMYSANRGKMALFGVISLSW